MTTAGEHKQEGSWWDRRVESAFRKRPLLSGLVASGTVAVAAAAAAVVRDGQLDNDIWSSWPLALGIFLGSLSGCTLYVLVSRRAWRHVETERDALATEAKKLLGERHTIATLLADLGEVEENRNHWKHRALEAEKRPPMSPEMQLIDVRRRMRELTDKGHKCIAAINHQIKRQEALRGIDPDFAQAVSEAQYRQDARECVETATQDMKRCLIEAVSDTLPTRVDMESLSLEEWREFVTAITEWVGFHLGIVEESHIQREFDGQWPSADGPGSVPRP